METNKEMSAIARSLKNPYTDDWARRGGKVIGYYCTYIPAEIIHAGGMLPYRIRATGSTSSELGDVYTAHTTCTFCRHSLDQAMRGEYHFLDGVVALNSCDHIRRLYDVWTHGKVQLRDASFFFHFLSVPIKTDALAVEWLANEFKRFKSALENRFKIAITDEALSRSIKAYNQKRKLLKSLYELRKQTGPPINGTEILEILIAGSSIPVERFNEFLKEILEERRNLHISPAYRARLLLSGGELDNPAYVSLIEELGGQIVTDFLCFGVRDFWELVDEESEPLSALAKRHIHSISCPRMIDYERRGKFIRELVKEFNVDGIIIQRMKYCDIWGGESARIKFETKKEGIPCLVLEREYLMGNVGQMRTRVQAFLETIGR